MKLQTWLERYGGGETEVRELAESLVKKTGKPALPDAPALCASAKDLLAALDKFDSELEAVGFE